MPIGQHHAMGPLDAGHRQAYAVWVVLAGSVTDQAARTACWPRSVT